MYYKVKLLTLLFIISEVALMAINKCRFAVINSSLFLNSWRNSLFFREKKLYLHSN